MWYLWQRAQMRRPWRTDLECLAGHPLMNIKFVIITAYCLAYSQAESSGSGLESRTRDSQQVHLSPWTSVSPSVTWGEEQFIGLLVRADELIDRKRSAHIINMDATIIVHSQLPGPTALLFSKTHFLSLATARPFESSWGRGGVATGVGGATLAPTPQGGWAGRSGAPWRARARARARRPQVREQDGGGSGRQRDGSGAGAGGGGRAWGSGPQLPRQPARRGAGVHPVQRLADGRRHRPRLQHLPAAARAVPE